MLPIAALDAGHVIIECELRSHREINLTLDLLWWRCIRSTIPKGISTASLWHTITTGVSSNTTDASRMHQLGEKRFGDYIQGLTSWISRSWTRRPPSCLSWFGAPPTIGVPRLGRLRICHPVAHVRHVSSVRGLTTKATRRSAVHPSIGSADSAAMSTTSVHSGHVLKVVSISRKARQFGPMTRFQRSRRDFRSALSRSRLTA
jgi:hypothetical protein